MKLRFSSIHNVWRSIGHNSRLSTIVLDRKGRKYKKYFILNEFFLIIFYKKYFFYYIKYIICTFMVLGLNNFGSYYSIVRNSFMTQ